MCLRFGRPNRTKKGGLKQILMNIPYTSIKTCDSETRLSHSIVQNARCVVFPSAMMSDIVSTGSQWVRIIAGRRPANFRISTWLFLDWVRDFLAASSRTKQGSAATCRTSILCVKHFLGVPGLSPGTRRGPQELQGCPPNLSNGAFGQVESLGVFQSSGRSCGF